MMARRATRITFDKTDLTRVPDAFVEGAALLLHLDRLGLVDEVGERVLVRREGGYPGVDLVLLLLVYFASGLKTGLRTAWDRLGPLSVSLAGLAGRKKLPAPASLSRGLSATEPELVRPAAQWLLGEFCGGDEVLRHLVTATYDACGEAWEVFDFDWTADTLRHRALPAGEDLPAPRRRSAETAEPGYPGRKRGDVQFCRAALQHAGSALWTHIHLAPGNGDGQEGLERALDSLVATAARVDFARERCLVRMDGQFGHVPGLTACRERGIAVLGRLNRASLLEDPDVLELLRTAAWQRVPDSGSGPTRFATDLGELTLHPGKRTKRPDGSAYEAVRVRVVASIYRATTGRGAGTVVDGWQVELFVADLPTTNWPAADCVATYYARAAEENRFAQEDRELGLGRIFSYHLPGQELATAVGLALWNLRIARGVQAQRPPQACPVPTRRASQPPSAEDLPPPSWPRDPVVLKVLAALDWQELLTSRPGWRWCTEAFVLLCPEGRPMALSGVREGAPDADRLGVIFRRPSGGCEQCGSRENCLHSERPRASKHLELRIDGKAARKLDQRLKLTRGRTAVVEPADLGPVHVTLPRFLPAEARRLHRERFRHATIHIELTEAKRHGHLRLVADSDADRQHRRKTWKQRVEDYAIDPATRIDVRVLGSDALRAFIDGPEQTGRGANSA
jgi:hypothetical protein